MRKTAVLLGLGAALLMLNKRTVASRKSQATEARYAGSFEYFSASIQTLFAKLGDPLQDGSGLTQAQSTWLATLSQMTPPADYPVLEEGNGAGQMGYSGSSWNTGERASLTTWADTINSICNKLINNNYMS